MDNDQYKIIRELAQKLYDRKGFNVFAIDVRGVSGITDYCIVADGNVNRHLLALADDTEDYLLSKGIKKIGIQGKGDNWLVIDFDDIMVHFFTPEIRERYRIEELWQDGKVIDLMLEVKDEV